MSQQSASAEFYAVGGTLKPGTPSYVERASDPELWQLLERGEYVYILTARQMGKSSLMARTRERLRQEGHGAALVDLTEIGTEKSAQATEQWYYGLVATLHRELALDVPLKPWWKKNADLPPVQRLVEFFRQLAIDQKRRVVIFVDEIESTIGLPFADDFFAAVRACYNARATEERFDRLSFVLLGVATPDQLIADPARTPFNIGQRIDLQDFAAEEARPLAAGLGGDDKERRALFLRILFWTSGHPYLTQKLCRLVAENPSSELAPDELVDALVEKHFFAESARRENRHFEYAQARLLAESGKPERLRLYRQIYRGRPIADQPTSPLHASLKLAGVVGVSPDGTLEIRNRLYRKLFDLAWVKRHTPVDKARLVAYGSIAASLLFVVLWFAVVAPRTPVEQLQLALNDYHVAEAAYQELLSNLFFPRARADELLANFWARRARRDAWAEARDQSLVNWLQAIRAYDVDTRRKEARHLIGKDYENLLGTIRHGARVNAVAFSPDGKTVLTGSYDRTAQLWRAESGEPIGQPMQHENRVSAVAFSPDGKAVLTGSYDRTVRLWRADTAEPIGPQR